MLLGPGIHCILLNLPPLGAGEFVKMHAYAACNTGKLCICMFMRRLVDSLCVVKVLHWFNICDGLAVVVCMCVYLCLPVYMHGRYLYVYAVQRASQRRVQPQ